MPILEVYKDDVRALVIATTGGWQTNNVRTRYLQVNVVIGDFIDFNSVNQNTNGYPNSAQRAAHTSRP